MNRWGSRKDYAKEVKLVRLKPYDSRVSMHGKKHKAGKVIALLLAVTSMLAVCLFGFYYVFDSKAKEKALEAAGTMEGNLPEGKGAEEMEEGLVGNVLTALDKQGLWDASDAQDLLASSDSQDLRGSQNLPGSSDSPDLPAPLIAIDPGHGGEEEGCGGNGAQEARANLQLALLLSEKLQALGFETLLIREDDDACPTPEERVRKAEDEGADIYVSIHGIPCKKGKDVGIKTWYDGESEEGWRLAQLIHRDAARKTKALDKEARETANLDVVRPHMPSCLIEAGFLAGSQGEEDAENREYREKLADGMAQGIDLYFNPKIMYLTFDDGPSKDNTVAVLDILKEKGIKATFFVVGENVRKNPEVARRIVEEGHTIGIHCNRHVYEDIYQSVDSYLEDFQKAYDAVYEETGVEVALFRFPGGSINSYNKNVYEEIIEKMSENGFIYFDWNASLEDASKHTTPKQLVQNAIDSAMGRKKVVMLAHDIKSDTAQCLEELIESLPEYRMEPLTPEVEPVHF